MPRLAVIDIGTNSIHMVLAEIDPDGSYKLLDRFKDMTRLGDGTFQTRRLTSEAMARGLGVLQNLTILARNKGYERIIMTATSAVREARNGGKFIEKVAQETGVRVQVVTGQEEARLIYLGVSHSMNLGDRSSLIVDVGGGSVELISGNQNKMFSARSLKLGAIRLKDQFLPHDPPSKSNVRELHTTIDKQIKAALTHLQPQPFDKLVATSGMAANLAEIIYLERTGIPIPQLNLAQVTLKEIRQTEALLASSSVKERLNIPGLDSRRVDTLLPAIAVLRRLLEEIGLKELIISDKAIREGVIHEFIRKNQEGLRTEREYPNIRLRHVIYLARRCRYPKTHSHHVAKLALALFDQTNSLHGLGECERELLEYAALLHDVGYLIHSREHHKHSYYLIKHSHLYGFTATEIDLMANVARYHRRAMPERDHEGSRLLSKESWAIVEKLSAILRIADGLDRTHFSVIRDLRVEIGKTVTLLLETAGDSEVEKWTTENRLGLFEKIFKLKVELVTQETSSA